MFFVVDGMKGITKDDHEIAAWLRDNFDFELGRQSSDFDDPFVSKILTKIEGEEKNIKPVPVDVQPPAETKRKRRLRLVVSKCDKGDNWDIINELYALAMGDPLFVSAQQGDGLHEIFREINGMFSPTVLEAYKEKKKRRRMRYDELRKELANEVTAELNRMNREFDLSRPLLYETAGLKNSTLSMAILRIIVILMRNQE